MINIKSDFVLPIKSPVITSYTSYSTAFSILPNYNQVEPWLYSNFINLWGEEQENGRIPIRFSSWDIMKVCPFLSYNELSYNFVKSMSNSFSEFIINSVLNGYYLILPYDKYYIPCCPDFYQTRHRQHTMLLYGYDEKERVFFVTDFFQTGKFSFQKLSFDIVETAIENVANIEPPDLWANKDKWTNITLIKYINTAYSLDVKSLINSVKDYINSENTVPNYENNIVIDGERFHIQKGNMKFGLENYSLLKNYMSCLKEGTKKFLDIRPLHALYDHKVLMLHRLDFLNKNGYLNNYDDLYDKFEYIRKICKINRSLMIKYAITSNLSHIDRIQENIDSLIVEDRAVMSEFLRNIVLNQ